MEPNIPLLPILLTTLLFLIMITKLLKRPKPKNLPPSPWKLPIIGNLHQLAAGGSLPHHTLRDLAMKHGPIMYLQLGQIPTIVISSPETAEEVLRVHDINFSNRPILLVGKIMSYDSTSIASSPYGAYWRQLRKFCATKLLSASRVKSFRSIREEEVSNLIVAISSRSGSAINLSKMILSASCGIISRAAFGDGSEEQDKLISIVLETMKIAGSFNLSDMFPWMEMAEVITGLRPKLENMHRESDKLFEKIIDQHREKKNMALRNGNGEEDEKDLLDVLLEVQAQGDLESPLTDNNIKAVMMDIFIGGSDTSSTTVEWAMSELLKNPKLMNEAQAEVRKFYDERGNVDETCICELKFLTAIIKETLRLHPAGPLLLPRECKENCAINGYEIPAKAKVIVNAWAIGRDPKYWNEPDKFWPERFVESSVDYKGTHFQYIPFGGGRRMCPGISFSVPNIELSLAKLLYHFDWTLAGGQRPEDLDMAEAFGLSVRRKQDLLLIPTLYRPVSVCA